MIEWYNIIAQIDRLSQIKNDVLLKVKYEDDDKTLYLLYAKAIGQGEALRGGVNWGFWVFIFIFKFMLPLYVFDAGHVDANVAHDTSQLSLTKELRDFILFSLSPNYFKY